MAQSRPMPRRCRRHFCQFSPIEAAEPAHGVGRPGRVGLGDDNDYHAPVYKASRRAALYYHASRFEDLSALG